MAIVPVPGVAPPAPVGDGPGRADGGRCGTARRSGGGAGAAAGRDGRAAGGGQGRAAEDVGQGAAVLARAAVTGGDGADGPGGDLRVAGAGLSAGGRGRRVLLVLAGDPVVVGVQ